MLSFGTREYRTESPCVHTLIILPYTLSKKEAKYFSQVQWYFKGHFIDGQYFSIQQENRDLNAWPEGRTDWIENCHGLIGTIYLKKERQKTLSSVFRSLLHRPNAKPTYILPREMKYIISVSGLGCRGILWSWKPSADNGPCDTIFKSARIMKACQIMTQQWVQNAWVCSAWLKSWYVLHTHCAHLAREVARTQKLGGQEGKNHWFAWRRKSMTPRLALYVDSETREKQGHHHQMCLARCGGPKKTMKNN